MKGTVEKYAIGVPNGLFGEAEKLLRLDEEERVFDETSSEMELTASEAVSPVTMLRDFRPMYPEDATAEIWSEKAPGFTGMVEMSLRENRISARTETLEDGSKKIFVLPEDQDRALEIVREIRDGTPPT